VNPLNVRLLTMSSRCDRDCLQHVRWGFEGRTSDSHKSCGHPCSTSDRDRTPSRANGDPDDDTC
jgi:hypothetical protein